MVNLEAPLHVPHRVVGVCNLTFLQVYHPVDEIVVILLENDARGWANRLIDDVIVEFLLLTLLQLGLFLFNDITRLWIILDLPLQEDPLTVLVGAWETIKDISPVTAIVLLKALLKQIVEDSLVGKANWQRFRVNLGLVFKFNA